jgi:hypothetical protein
MLYFGLNSILNPSLNAVMEITVIQVAVVIIPTDRCDD